MFVCPMLRIQFYFKKYLGIVTDLPSTHTVDLACSVISDIFPTSSKKAKKPHKTASDWTAGVGSVWQFVAGEFSIMDTVNRQCVCGPATAPGAVTIFKKPFLHTKRSFSRQGSEAQSRRIRLMSRSPEKQGKPRWAVIIWFSLCVLGMEVI